MKYDIIKGKPPVWEQIKKNIPGATSVDSERIWITVGHCIYAESLMPREILEHELIHVRQQTKDMSADEWWDQWLNNEEFRYVQELEGYRRQIEMKNRELKDRNKMYKYKRDIAEILSGEIYGYVRTFNEVMKDLS